MGEQTEAVLFLVSTVSSLGPACIRASISELTESYIEFELVGAFVVLVSVELVVRLSSVMILI